MFCSDIFLKTESYGCVCVVSVIPYHNQVYTECQTFNLNINHKFRITIKLAKTNTSSISHNICHYNLRESLYIFSQFHLNYLKSLLKFVAVIYRLFNPFKV